MQMVILDMDAHKLHSQTSSSLANHTHKSARIHRTCRDEAVRRETFAPWYCHSRCYHCSIYECLYASSRTKDAAARPLRLPMLYCSLENNKKRKKNTRCVNR